MSKLVLFVDRQPSAPDWTLSNFYSLDQTIKGVGVEDEYRAVKKKGETRIWNGTYEMGLRYSPHFSSKFFRDDEGNLIEAKDRITVSQIAKYHTEHEMIWVMNVKDFEYILWHPGNTDDDTDGCYCVGTMFAPMGVQKGVSGSKAKYMEIYPKIWKAIKTTGAQVTYRDVA
jgi:hypothetical protein